MLRCWAAMEMELGVLHVEYPLWLRFAFAATLFFGLMGLWLVRHVRYPILTSMLPILGNAAVAFFGLARISEGLSLTGKGRHAVAAGCAEAQRPILLGAGVALLLFAVLTLWPVAIPSWRRERKLVAAFTTVMIVLIAADVAICRWMVAPERQFAGRVQTVTTLFFYAALMTFVVACGSVLLTRTATGPSPLVSRIPVALGCAAAATLFAVLRVLTSELQNIALGR
jgi:hypothetical protein